ncbi:Acyl-CoA thioesterase FadM (FadM) (PDB:2FUJ) [Commensalibacter communis]|uniref:Acyl-CoA thioesterase FadM (FadM) n=2 Tax=Commensalibacter communis TaxID=2972786 RepID=A0A9W4TMV0_9PROT|nr:YbgC/FadM family acyl-CoA thioesterase [Commensalibacter communis]CAI3924554.1 Acyl-CoA thioesterase FadM (FadM) (PDB:2FUJ) [Commensalibacter communis]CAI3924582.1 Acyl-CoA thioesterase FadM (FadM) (PDB:2FUJ) [Commensalibacter communis]CAI3928240.1 Acyl-CoA thioesterase FadM (FadM) (PDB:2FUJ) [Commensalibacter communis]CAI3928762.1 Acyl-CoA thioesterase FadM (FadM) (PDB:2FUJ) [Commensalibacter communis]CAI3930083.1 Acyl-CoA thioesterase FadM (FadM) (PDB:2FUJ) [Commensalibacter communis]
MDMSDQEENIYKTKTRLLSKEEIQNYQFRICYEDTDAGGVVYHAKYLGIAERARTECIRRLGGTLAELYKEYGQILVVRQMEIQYRKPLFLDDMVNVKTSLITALGASCWLSQVFSREGEIVTEIKLQLVCLKKGDYMPTPFPRHWQKMFDALTEVGA